MPKPNVVTITASAPVEVISERIGDRERFENGRDLVAAGEEQSFIVHPGQSLRIVEPAPNAELVEEQPTGAVVDGAAKGETQPTGEAT